MYKLLTLYYFIFLSVLASLSGSLYSREIKPKLELSSSFDLQSFIPFFEKEAQKALDIWGAPGMAVVIVVDGRVAYAKGFGITAMNHPEPVTERTIFPIASLSKPFVATLVMQLEGAGKLSIDDAVHNFFPDIQLGSYQQGQSFVVKDLMSHNSGLPPFSGDSLNWIGASAEETVQALQYIPHQHPSRHKFGYQNVLFGVLGLYLEKATQQSFASLMQAYIIEPLKLEDTVIGESIMQPIPWWKRAWQRLLGQYRVVAQPHDVWKGKTQQLAYSPLFYTFLGSTGVNTSAYDLGKWMIAWMSQQDLKPAWPIYQYQKMIAPQAHEEREDDIFYCHQRMKNIAYGMGWYAHTYEGEQVISHQGGLRGVRSVMTLSLNKRIGIAVISNFGGMRISALPEAMRNIFWDAYLGITYVDWNKQLKEKMDKRQKEWMAKREKMNMRNPAPSQPLSYYVGTYQHRIYGDMEIRDNGSQGLVMVYRGRRIALQHVNGNTYRFEVKDLSDFFADPENPGTIEWGGPRREKADLCDIQLLYEGREPFRRVEDH